MDKSKFTAPISLSQIQITDSFWKNEMELVRTEVIPYQWAALNDNVEGAAPSYCMRNFKIAGKMNREKHQKGAAYIEPKYTFRGFEALPENPDKLEDKFYGFVFQDSDFSKWIEAVGYSLTQHPDAELEKLADSAIDIVCAAQQDDGYLDTYYIINGKDCTVSDILRRALSHTIRRRARTSSFARRSVLPIAYTSILAQARVNARAIQGTR